MQSEYSILFKFSKFLPMLFCSRLYFLVSSQTPNVVTVSLIFLMTFAILWHPSIFVACVSTGISLIVWSNQTGIWGLQEIHRGQWYCHSSYPSKGACHHCDVGAELNQLDEWAFRALHSSFPFPHYYTTLWKEPTIYSIFPPHSIFLYKILTIFFLNNLSPLHVPIHALSKSHTRYLDASPYITICTTSWWHLI